MSSPLPASSISAAGRPQVSRPFGARSRFHVYLLLFFCLLLDAGAGARAELAFEPNYPPVPPVPVPFPVGPVPTVGQGPTAVVLADVNADGIADAVVTNPGGDSVSVLLGTGDASLFGTQQIFNTGLSTSPTSVAVDNLRNDGDPYPDLITANNSGTSNSVTVLLGTGDFDPMTPLLPFETQPPVSVGALTPFSIAVANLDNDPAGNLDVVTANANPISNSVSMLLGTGLGTFGSPTIFPVGANPNSVAIGRFGSLDSLFDLAVANTDSGDVSVLLGTGNFAPPSNAFPAPPFPTKQVGLSPPVSAPITVVVADVNGDLLPDLVTANAGENSVSILLGESAGTFQDSQTCQITGGTFPTSIVVADLDGDGKVDFVTGNLGENSISVLLGTGDFDPATPTLPCQEVLPAFALAPSGTAGGNFVPVAVRDLDNDNKPDIAAAYTDVLTSSSHLAVLVNKSTPSISLSPASQNFGSVLVNPSPAPSQEFDLTNTGSTSIDIGTISTNNGAFTIIYPSSSSPCPAPPFSLADGTSCKLTVRFSPSVNGSFTSTLSVLSPTGFPLASSDLSGTSVTAPAPVLDPTSLDFGSQTVGDTSAAKVVTLTNNGGSAYGITSITASANFGVTHNCGASLPAGNSCILQITFTPTAVGLLNGTLTVTGTTGSPVVAALSGTGSNPPSGPVPVLDKTTLDFGTQTVGTTSAPQPLILSNAGDTAYDITSITASANFGVTHNCGASLPAGNSCILQITFTPTAVGLLNGTLTVTGTTGSPVVAALNGTGSNPPSGPVPVLDRTTLDFGTQTVGTTSAPQPLILSNAGDTAYDITSITASANFGVTHNCGASLPAGNSCILQITFTPMAVGLLNGTLTVTGTTGSPVVAALSGTGLTPPAGPAPVLNITSLDFGDQILGTTSAPRTVILTNAGDAAYDITSITANTNAPQAGTVAAKAGVNAFSVSNDCGDILDPGMSCILQVSFTPPATGLFTGTLTVTGTTGNPVVASLRGTGANEPLPPPGTSSLSAPNPWLEPIDPFGPQTVGTTSAPHSTRLRNLGTANYIIISIVTSGDFGVVNDCPQVLVPKAYCTLQLTFTPETEGALEGLVTVNGNFSIPAIRGISGTGVNGPVSPEAAPALAPIAPFGAQVPGTTSAAQAIALSNTGGTAYGIASITASGDFAVSHDCGTSLAPGASCTLRVTFTPTANGSRTGSLTVTGTTGDPLVNTLIGTGANPGSVTPPNTVPSSPAPSVTADLRLKIKGPTTARVGKAMTYRFAVRNQARRRITAPEVIVTAGLEGLAAEGAALTRVPAYCAVTDHTLTCNLGNLRGKKRKQFKIAVQPVVQGTMNVTGVVAGFVIDPKPDNNRASKSTPVR